MRKNLLFLIFSFLALSAFAQRTISGTVINKEDNSPLPGVNVLEKGTNNGTVTDRDGRFDLQVSAQNPVLVFSFIGMAPLEVNAGNQSSLSVTMTPDITQLSEVVVVGYGTEKRTLLNESVGVVNSEAIRDLPVPTLDNILQGQTAGVQVVQNSGTPGGESAVRVRGISSINLSSQPLYVIDGIPVTTGDFGQLGYSGQGINALSDLNPSEIESISVLKDAAAAAVYGARASNGIILITTKRGKNQRAVISFNAYAGVQEVWRTLDMLDARGWMEYRNDLQDTEVFSPEQIANPAIDTDWQDVIFQTAPISNYELSASGGNEKTKFFLSGDYFQQEGTVIGTDFQRFNNRINIDHILSDKFSLGTSIGLTYSKTNRVEGDQTLHGPLPNGISTPAVFPVYNPDGSYNQDGPYSNPVSIANEAINQNFTFRTLGNVYGELQILPGLSLTSKWGLDFFNLREHSYESIRTVQGARFNGLGFETYSNVMNVVSNNILRYVKTMDDHEINAMIGFSFEDYQSRSSYIRAQDFADPDLEYISSAATIVEASSSGLDRGLRSYFGKFNYNFKNKYLFTFSGRVDGSTRFSKENRYGFFPAGSFAWRAIEEDFMQAYNATISDLKFRVSYGITGNDAIPDFLYQAGYNITRYDENQNAIYPRNIPNPDLKWEQTAQFNIGLDIGFFENRLTFTADYYDKQTKDLLLDRPLPPNSGFSGITENVGRLENKGLELTLGYTNTFGDLRWNSQLNVSGNRNKVLELYNDQPLDDLGRGSNRVEEGEPIGIFYTFKSLGVDPSTGDIVFADTDLDGEITVDDRVKVGNPHPLFIGGFNNQLNYKGFDLGIFFQWSYGNDVFHGSRLFLESLQGGDNQIAAVERRWQNPGDITDIPRATLDPVKSIDNKRNSSRFIEDGSYLRLKNITLGYSFSTGFLQKIAVSSLRVYLSAQNLFTITDYTGLDPEVNYSGTSTQILGTDFFTYPQSRTYTIGVNVKL